MKNKENKYYTRRFFVLGIILCCANIGDGCKEYNIIICVRVCARLCKYMLT